jgi:adenosylhomocysteine nucleosidase
MNLINVSGQNKILAIVALPMELPIASWGARSKIVYSGVGKINTSINLIDAIRIYKPDLVVNLGTAGSLNSKISGVVEVHAVIERDFDAFPLCKRGLIPFEEGSNRHCSGYDGVICASGDSFVREFDTYLEQMGVDIVDMELIAIARVCNKYNIPWRSFKFISDYIGRNIDEPWQDGVIKASKALIEKFDAEFF